MNRGIKVLQTSALPLGYVARGKKIANLERQKGFAPPFDGHPIRLILGGVPHCPSQSCSLSSTGCVRNLFESNKTWSGKRDSNPRHSAWEADALPTELLPQLYNLFYTSPFLPLQNCFLKNCKFFAAPPLSN